MNDQTINQLIIIPSELVHQPMTNELMTNELPSMLP